MLIKEGEERGIITLGIELWCLLNRLWQHTFPKRPSKYHQSNGVWEIKSQRVERLPREAAAYIILRRKGQSINNIAKAFGRSTSFVYRIISRARVLALNRKDLRKLPRLSRTRYAARMRFILKTLLKKWEAFILGEGEKPP